MTRKIKLAAATAIAASVLAAAAVGGVAPVSGSDVTAQPVFCC